MNTDDDITGPINIGNSEEYTILELAKQSNRTYRLQIKGRLSFAASDDPSRDAGYRTCKSELDGRPSLRST